MPWGSAKDKKFGYELGERIAQGIQKNKRRQALEMASNDDSAAHEEAEKKKKRKDLLLENDY